MLLDFQSDVSGLWSEDLLRSSHTFTLDTPVPRDVFMIGAYTYMFQIHAVSSMLQMDAASGRSPPYYPAPVQGADGWLALGPRSELHFVWNAFRINKHTLTMWSSYDDDASFLTRDERTFPNVPLKLHPQSAWWHRGYLVSPTHASVKIAGMTRAAMVDDIQWLKLHHADRTAFVLFSNDSYTLLPERVYNSLFYGSNVYHVSTIPHDIRLAPGLSMPKSDWFHEEAFTHTRWIDIGVLPLEVAEALVAEHPLPNCSAADLAVLSLRTTLRRYEVVINADTGDLSLVHTPVNDHLSGWQLTLVVSLVMLFIVMFLVRSVFLKPQVHSRNTSIRKFNATRYLTIGFRTQGSWFLMFAQAASVSLVLTAFWASDKLPSMRKESGTPQLIYWVITIFLHVNALGATLNILLQLSSFFDVLADAKSVNNMQIMRARMFVITKGFLTQSLLLAVWIVLMDRTAIDITNWAAALFSLLIVCFSIIDALILFDRITFNSANPRAQLWPSFKVYRERSVPLGDRLSFYYAGAVLVWMLAYMCWTFYFSATLQMYEQILISMATISTRTLHIMCWSMVIFLAEYGVRIATTLTQVNHVSGS